MIADQDYFDAAQELGAEVAYVKAVAQVESLSSGFFRDGSPKILFERHVFYRELLRTFGETRATEAFETAPTLCNPRSGGYAGGMAEHERLRRAVAIDRACALKSASWGAFQIMGFNWPSTRFRSLQKFINAMYHSETEHMQAFVDFIKADKKLHKAVQRKDSATFARIYNGRDHKNYDRKIDTAYAEITRG